MARIDHVANSCEYEAALALQVTSLGAQSEFESVEQYDSPFVIKNNNLNHTLL